MLRLVRSWVSLALVLGMALAALGACSAAELKPAATLEPDPETGIVILSVTRSGAREFDLFVWLKGPGQWVPRPIVLYAHSRARDWAGGASLDATPLTDPEGRLVVLKLPPGTYRIELWNGQSDEGGMNQDGFDIASEALDLSFTVQPGTVSYLGSLHIQLPNRLNYQANLMVANHQFAVEDRRERDLGVVRARFADASHLNAVAQLPVQYAQAGQEIRYYIYNRKVGDPNWP